MRAMVSRTRDGPGRRWCRPGFNAEKGFGFIEQDGGGPDVFAHYSEINGNGYRELKEGEHVTFDIGQGQGPQAQNITRG